MDEHEQRQILNEWLERHQGLLFKVVRAYAFTPQDREDLFQDVATQVWDSIPRYRAESAETTWLYRVALFTAMRWSRKERRRREDTRSLDGLEHTLLEPAKPTDPRLDWLYEQIAQLDEVERSLTLMMLDGFSYREIADTLGISESNVGVKLTRIRKHLTEKSNDLHNEPR
jgi:RNA polymerase sigma-70 factor, ECF subfamily